MVRGQNALFKIATKQYLGRLMILEGGGQNALFKIAAKPTYNLHDCHQVTSAHMAEV